MMKRNLKQKLNTCAVVLLVTVFFIPAYAGAFKQDGSKRDRGFDKKRHHKSACGIWRNPRIVQDLGLTEDQVKSLRDADFTFREKELELKSQLDALRLKMEKAFSDDTVVESDVIALAQKIADLRGKMFIQDIESQLTVNKLLTADQIKKLRLHNMFRKKKGPRKGDKYALGRQKSERPDDKRPLKN